MYAVDFHSHPDWYPESRRAAVVNQINERRIVTVAASVDADSYRSVRALAALSPYIVPTFGVHPERAARVFAAVNGELTALDPFLEQSALIGEIGLDYYWANEVPHDVQEKVFIHILQHCHVRKKVCVIHTKGAERRVADILADFPGALPVIHWYSGPERVYADCMDRGYAATFGCGLRYSPHERELLAHTPRESILAETDNPVGEPWLCGQNGAAAAGIGCDDTPALIFRVLRDIASVLGTDEAAATRLVYENARRLYALAARPPYCAPLE